MDPNQIRRVLLVEGTACHANRLKHVCGQNSPNFCPLIRSEQTPTSQYYVHKPNQYLVHESKVSFMEKLHGRIDGVNSFALGDQRKVIGTNKPIRKPGSMGDQVLAVIGVCGVVNGFESLPLYLSTAPGSNTPILAISGKYVETGISNGVSLFVQNQCPHHRQGFSTRKQRVAIVICNWHRVIDISHTFRVQVHGRIPICNAKCTPWSN